jgi:hypothetical protein
MKVNWIIENFTKEKSFAELIKAVEELGYPLIKIQGDYTKKLIRDKFPHYLNIVGDAIYHPQQCVIVNGTIKMCRIIKEEFSARTDDIIGAKPVLYCDWPKYECSAYYSHFGPYLFNDKYCLMSLKEIVRQKFDVWGQYGKDSCIFIRPSSGEKTFQAGILAIEDLGTLHSSNTEYEHDLMLVSTPKNIKWEGRFVVSKYKEIIASSTYKFQGVVAWIPSVPTGATKFCQELLDRTNYVPDSVYCFDLCEDSDGKFWLLELSSFSSAGLYATDKKKIVQRVSEIAWEDFNKIEKY